MSLDDLLKIRLGKLDLPSLKKIAMKNHSKPSASDNFTSLNEDNIQPINTSFDLSTP